MPRDSYPETVTESLRAHKTYNPATLRALKVFRRSKAWGGSYADRKDKFSMLHDMLNLIYDMNTTLVFAGNGTGDSGNSCYIPALNKIILSGKLSVVTYLHEFGHARGWGERYACVWSLNLFRRIFPRSYERCTHAGHTLVQSEPRSSVAGYTDVPMSAMTPSDLIGLPVRITTA